MKSTLVILTLNEIDGLKEIFPQIPTESVDEVVAIDGGSTDGTIKFLEQRNIPVIKQSKPGRGNAFIEAPKHVSGDIIIYFSPDGNEDPKDIPKLREALEKGYDLAIASRFMDGGKSDDSDDPFLVRKMGNIFFTFLVNLIWKADVIDSINGFRGIKKSCLKKLDLDASEHEIEFQMTIRSAKLNYNIKEIPTIEKERIGGERKANTLRLGFVLTKALLKELL